MGVTVRIRFEATHGEQRAHSQRFGVQGRTSDGDQKRGSRLFDEIKKLEKIGLKMAGRISLFWAMYGRKSNARIIQKYCDRVQMGFGLSNGGRTSVLGATGGCMVGFPHRPKLGSSNVPATSDH